jgi:peptidoglycan/LPS O-acetylase OafA/YrhL
VNVRADRFPLFDSLRALAALGVVVFHAAFFAELAAEGNALGRYAARLDVGVTVFFLISGFLLYRPFVAARFEERPAPHAGAYAWRRFLRIVPAYWVALTVVALVLALPNVFSARGVATFYGFAQIYSPSTAGGGISQAWTLCVEVTFYALLPLWALAMRGLGRGDRRVLATELAGLALLFGGSLVYKLFALSQVSPNSLASPPWLMPLPNFLDQFALGMGLAVLSAWSQREEREPGPLALAGRHPWACWLAAALAFWWVSAQIGLSGVPGEKLTTRSFLSRHELYSVVALGLLLPAVFGDQERGLVRRLLASRVLLYLGLVSYGIYLYHLAAIDLVDDALGGSLPDGATGSAAVYLVLGLAGAVAAASASYYLVERRALRLKDRIGPRPAPARDEALAEPAPAEPVAAPRGG